MAVRLSGAAAPPPQNAAPMPKGHGAENGSLPCTRGGDSVRQSARALHARPPAAIRGPVQRPLNQPPNSANLQRQVSRELALRTAGRFASSMAVPQSAWRRRRRISLSNRIAAGPAIDRAERNLTRPPTASSPSCPRGAHATATSQASHGRRVRLTIEGLNLARRAPASHSDDGSRHRRGDTPRHKQRLTCPKFSMRRTSSPDHWNWRCR
jgi:hypothetical protein